MGIDTKRMNVGKFLNSINEVYCIPLYQRDYDWGKEQWNDLWDDLIKIEGDETHFIGSIIAISNSNQKGLKYFEIVDGQQRATTVLIMLMAIRDIARKSDPQRALYIDNYFLRSSTIDEKESKLVLGRKDNKIFKRLLNQKPLNGLENNEQVVQAYEFFKKQLTQKWVHWEEVYRKLIDSFDLVLMVTDSYYDAYKLFETLNNRGLSLSSVDLIKNYLLKRFTANEHGLEECIELWDLIIQNIEEIKDARYDKVKFFRHFIFSIEPGIVSKPKLYEKYQKLIDGSENLISLVEDIWSKSETYIKLYTASFGVQEIDEHLRSLVRIEATISYSLLLRAFSENLKKSELIKIIKAIEIFTLRRSICKISTRDLDRFYNHLATEAFKTSNPVDYIINYLKNRTPSDNEYIANFQTRDFNRSDQTKFILEIIEYYLNDFSREKIINGRSSVHIEHILPREINRSSTQDKYGAWHLYLGDKSAQYKLYVNKIGNLTLLGSELNVLASNNPFGEKKKNYSNSNIIMTKQICHYDEWNYESINLRSERLARIANEIWNFKNV